MRMHVRTVLDVLPKAQCLLDLCRIREATVLYRGTEPHHEQFRCLSNDVTHFRTSGASDH